MCLLLFLFASQIIPVNVAGVLLIVAAVALFAAEVKVASYGLLTVSGLAAMVLGAMMLVDAPPELRIPLRTLLPAALLMAAGTFAAGAAGGAGAAPPPADRRGGHGRAGAGGGGHSAQRRRDGCSCTASAGRPWPTRPLQPGEKVTVTAVEGLTLRVRKGA